MLGGDSAAGFQHPRPPPRLQHRPRLRLLRSAAHLSQSRSRHGRYPPAGDVLQRRAAMARGGPRGYLEKVAAAIAAAAPDVVGLQEVHRGTRQSRLAGSGRGARPADRDGGPVRQELRDGAGAASSATPCSPAARCSPPRSSPSPVRASRGRSSPPASPSADAEVDFHVTHLAAWGRCGRAARSVQIAGLVETLKQSAGPVHSGGDLNAPPGAPEIGTLMAAELFRKCGDGVAVTHRFMRQQIDYVFAGSGVDDRRRTG